MTQHENLEKEIADEKPRDRLLRIGSDCAGRLIEPWRSLDHDELFYDDDGLPK